MGPELASEVSFVFSVNINILAHQILYWRYERKSECLKKSYSSNHKRQVLYRGQPVRLEVDGDFTFDENLCDVEALEMVTDLEMKNIQKMDDLPGVNFTKEQTFFINIAQVLKVLNKLGWVLNYFPQTGLLRIDWKRQPNSHDSSKSTLNFQRKVQIVVNVLLSGAHICISSNSGPGILRPSTYLTNFS